MVTLITFAVPAAYFTGIFLLSGIALTVIGLDIAFKLRLPSLSVLKSINFTGSRGAFVASVFAGFIMLFCVLDLTLFPIPLFGDPTTYATFDGGRAHIRHVSNMSWTLPPIALLCLRNKTLRRLLVVVGFIFPILVLDRNRIFAVLFASMWILIIRKSKTNPFSWKKVALFGFAGVTCFSVLGILRSGSLDSIQLPFSPLFKASPLVLQWLLLYVSAGIYNFSTILAIEYRNSDFLMNQIVPFSGSVETAGSGIPLDAETINVGTEFFPFLMAFGPGGVIFSAFALYALLLCSVALLRWKLTVFSVLIFLRLGYVCIMSPFAPQAFTWTNFGFIALCLSLWIVSILLPTSDLSRATPRTALRRSVID
jgi:hypothetical protein